MKSKFGGTCGIHGRQESCARERDHLENHGVNDRIISKWVLPQLDDGDKLD